MKYKNKYLKIKESYKSIVVLSLRKDKKLLQLRRQLTNKDAQKENASLKLNFKVLDIEFLKLKEKSNSLSLTKGDLIFLRYEKKKDLDWGLTGYVHKETINHLCILVQDTKRNDAYKYTIHKNTILGIKHYCEKLLNDSSHLNYNDLLTKWRTQSIKKKEKEE